MKEFYFAESVYEAARAPLIEKELMLEIRTNYLHRIISTDFLEEIVSHLEELQRELLRRNSRLRRVDIGHTKLNDRLWGRLSVGQSSLCLQMIKGSDKDAAASEKFNDGWWNCFESFAIGLEYTVASEVREKICTDVLSDAGVQSAEAFLRAESAGSQRTKDLIERYANLKFVE